MFAEIAQACQQTGGGGGGGSCDAASVAALEVRKTPTWSRSWANFIPLYLYSHWNARSNSHLLGQPNTFLAGGNARGAAGGVVAGRWHSLRRRAHEPGVLSVPTSLSLRRRADRHAPGLPERPPRNYGARARRGPRLCPAPQPSLFVPLVFHSPSLGRLSRQPEIDRIDQESGSNLRPLKGFSVKLLGQLANLGQLCEFHLGGRADPLTPIVGCPPNPASPPGGGWAEAAPSASEHYFVNVLSADQGCAPPSPLAARRPALEGAPILLSLGVSLPPGLALTLAPAPSLIEH